MLPYFYQNFGPFVLVTIFSTLPEVLLKIVQYIFRNNTFPIHFHFTEIHRSSLRKIEQILNRSATKFYNSNDVNATTAELGQMIDNLSYETKATDGNKI